MNAFGQAAARAATAAPHRTAPHRLLWLALDRTLCGMDDLNASSPLALVTQGASTKASPSVRSIRARDASPITHAAQRVDFGVSHDRSERFGSVSIPRKTLKRRRRHARGLWRRGARQNRQLTWRNR